jgi:hypothetical protein
MKQNSQAMKKFTVSFLVIFSSLLGMSQAYHPLIRPNTYWDVGYRIEVQFCYTSAHRYEFIFGDTTVNGHSYRNTRRYPITGEPGPGMTICPPYQVMNQWAIMHYMREDTLSKKVYVYCNYCNPTDQLLYDFSLNEGDTLNSEYATGGNDLVITSVSDTVLFNGQVRKKFSFIDPFGVPCCYVESIGSPYGLFERLITLLGGSSDLMCVKEIGVNLAGIICDTYFTGVTQINDDPVSVFPNPAHDKITVTLEGSFQPCVLKLFDTRGREVLATKLSTDENVIPVSQLDPGIYIYRLRSENSSGQGKLILY